MEIITFMRAGQTVTVAGKDDAGNFISRQFPGSMSDAEVKADFLGLPKPEKKTDAISPEKPQAPAKTVPEPPVTPKKRITRQDMIDALDEAGEKDFDPNNYSSLRTAYESLKQKGAK